MYLENYVCNLQESNQQNSRICYCKNEKCNHKSQYPYN